MTYKLLRTLSILSFTGLASCGTITVYDSEVCGDLGESGAHCAHTLTNGKRDVSKTDWDELRVGWLCMSPQAFSDTESALDQFCTAYNVCDYQTRESLQAAFNKIHQLTKARK